MVPDGIALLGWPRAGCRCCLFSLEPEDSFSPNKPCRSSFVFSAASLLLCAIPGCLWNRQELQRSDGAGTCSCSCSCSCFLLFVAKSCGLLSLTERPQEGKHSWGGGVCEGCPADVSLDNPLEGERSRNSPLCCWSRPGDCSRALSRLGDFLHGQTRSCPGDAPAGASESFWKSVPSSCTAPGLRLRRARVGVGAQAELWEGAGKEQLGWPQAHPRDFPAPASFPSSC